MASWPDEVDDKLLECLIHWPKGTVGWYKQVELLKQLNAMCKEHGYGAVHQYANWIRELWYHPEKEAEFRKRQEEHLSFMEECRETIEEDKKKKKK